MHKTYYLLIGAGLLAGMYFAGAASGTGIYSTPVGSTLANVWSAGAKAGSSGVAKTGSSFAAKP